MWIATYKQKCLLYGVDPREEVLQIEGTQVRIPGNTLELFQSRLTDQDLLALLQTAMLCLPVNSLILPYNNITSLGCKYLAEALCSEMGFLTHVDLSYNSIAAGGVEEMEKALVNNQTLHELILAGNPLGDGCGDTFASILRQNCCLTTLDLHSTDLNLKALMPICYSLSQNTGLRILRLGRPLLSNPEDVNYAVHYISLGLCENRTLKELELSHFNFYDSHLQSLLPSLSCSGVIRLCLGGNKFSQSAGALLAELLNARAELETLDVSANRLGDVGATALGCAVGQHSNLSALCLDHNGIGEKGLEALADGIRNSTSLRRLTLWGNALDTSAAAHTMHAIEERLNLMEHTDFKVYFMGDEIGIYRTS